MKTILIASCLFLFACGIPATQKDVPAEPKGSVCWPPHWAGVVVGITTDQEVQRLLGRGILRNEEGDTGGRYFIDPTGTATLHVVSYTDFVVGDVVITEGVDPAIKPDEHGAAISKWFNPKEGFGNRGALNLGSSRSEVLKNLGEPAEAQKDGGWRYNSKCACELPVGFTVYFTNNRLTKIFLSAPPG